ncbi:MAG TPA: hypothetical protein VIJ29_00710 [Candidatus Paceibacterota bacterium]
MKRLLILAGLIVAIVVSFGGNSLVAHAQTAATTQTLTPAQTAALQQELDVANATLANLEMQAGVVPPADAGTPSVIPASIAGTGTQGGTAVATAPAASTGLSASQVSAFQGTLNTLATALTQLSASVAANTTLTPSQDAAVATTLNGMQGTLVAMANTIATAGNSASAPVAITPVTGSPVAVNSAPSAATTPSTAVGSAPTTAPSTPTVAQTQPATVNTVPQTAQASSLWSFTKSHWPTIVIILLVIAILAILFWPEKETVRTVPTATAGSGKPKSAPTSTITMNQNTASSPARPMASSNTPPPATPVANAVAAPAQK